MKICFIAAMAKNRVIGKDNDLPWKIPEEMAFFRAKTKGHPCIMGRKTFESMPGALPHRENIVVTQQKDYSRPGITVVGTVREAIEHARKSAGDKKEIFIIGGAEIFRAAMPLADRIYLSVIDIEVDGQARMPEIPMAEFRETAREERAGPPPFVIHTYERMGR